MVASIPRIYCSLNFANAILICHCYLRMVEFYVVSEDDFVVYYCDEAGPSGHRDR